MAVDPYRVARGLGDGPEEGPVLDRPAIDEEILVPPARKGDRAAGRVARQAQRARSRLESLQLPERRAAEDLEDPGSPVHGGRRLEGLARVGAERERDGRIAERGLGDGCRHRARLGLGRGQELAPGGGPGKKPLDQHVGAARAWRGLLADRSAVLEKQPDRLGARPVGGRQGQARDRRDRGQGFAAKPVRPDPRQVLVGEDLGRRVALEGQPRVLRRHPRAVVAHEDALHAPAVDLHVDARRRPVERVLDELLDRRGRPLDDLAGGDAVDDGALEPMDSRHRSSVYLRVRALPSRDNQ